MENGSSALVEEPFAVVDLFAGPGGLAEGFAQVKRKDGSAVYKIAVSVEKEAFAHKTLRLRSFLRQFKGHFPDLYYEFLNRGLDEPDWKEYFPEQWAAAEAEALPLTLGTQAAADVLYPRLEALRQTHGDRTIVIGGPPCQAYSLVGRARNLGNADYVFENDDRHELYKAYVDVLSRLRPTAFVMENVKGLLSSKSHGDLLFKRVLADL